MQSSNQSIPYGDVLYPTEEEFSDFEKFVNDLSVSPQFANSSLIKVRLKDCSSKNLYETSNFHR